MSIKTKSIYKDLIPFTKKTNDVEKECLKGIYVTNTGIFATNSFIALSVDMETDVTEGSVVFVPYEILKAHGAGVVSVYDCHAFSNGARIDIPAQQFDVKEQYSNMRKLVDMYTLTESDGVFPLINPSLLSETLAFIAKHDEGSYRGVNIYHTAQPYRPVYVTSEHVHAYVMPINK